MLATVITHIIPDVADLSVNRVAGKAAAGAGNNQVIVSGRTGSGVTTLYRYICDGAKGQYGRCSCWTNTRRGSYCCNHKIVDADLGS